MAQQIAGPQYAQQIQAAQQQAQAQEALAAAQRKTTSQTFRNSQIQPIPVPQAPPQPQVVSELRQPNRPYYGPPAQGFQPAPAPAPSQRLEQQAKAGAEELEDYDVSDCCYGFYFCCLLGVGYSFNVITLNMRWGLEVVCKNEL